METVTTSHAPAAIGPYSQAVIVGDLVFTAGQVALDPTTMELVGDDITTQTARVLANLEAVLAAAGSGLDRVVKATVYLADMGDFAAMNEVYARHFGDHRPARSAVAVKTVPKNGLVEIDVIATRG